MSKDQTSIHEIWFMEYLPITQISPLSINLSVYYTVHLPVNPLSLAPGLAKILITTLPELSQEMGPVAP